MWFSGFRTLKRKVDKMALDLTKLNDAVAKQQTVVSGVQTLLASLSAEVRDLASQADPAMQAKLNDFAAKVDTNSQALADAVAANTIPPAPPAP